MSDRGRDRRRANMARSRSLGKESLTAPGHQLVRACMTRTVEAVEDWVRQSLRQRPANRPTVLPLVRAVPVKPACLLALRVALDFAVRGESWQSAVHAVASSLDEERSARWLAKAHAGSWQSIRRRAYAIPERAAARLRRAARLMARDKGFQRWTVRERLQLGAFFMSAIEDFAGLIAVDRVKAGRKTKLVLRVLPEVADWIMEASRRDELLEPLYMPMLDAPADWGPGKQGGYSTGLVARKHLVKNRSKKTRELVGAADMPVVYEAVNRLQRTPWEINPDVLEVARTLFEAGEAVAGLEKAEDAPMPPRPKDGPTKEWMRRRFLVRRENMHRASRRVEAARVLWLGKRLQPEGALHFPQQLDFRGRVYPVPQFLQPQGPDLARGLLRFAKGAWIDGQRPEFWLHGANCLGLDKLELGERYQRIIVQADAIRAVAHDPLENRWWQEADEPWQFLAWCLEAGQLLETGRVLTKVPCYVDGTNNGLQILSLLLRDPVGGAATNCTPGPRRDVYQDVADALTQRLRDLDDDTARGWLSWFPGGRVPRACAKRPVMCVPYGLTPWSCKTYVADWFDEEIRQGKENPWGEDSFWHRIVALSDHLWASIQAVLGPALDAMEWLRECARVSIEHGVGPVWTSPSGFPVRQSYTNWEVQQVRTKFGERVRWVRSRKAGDRLNARRHVNALPPNFVHSLDAAVLARVVARFDGPVSTIHDSFGTTADRVDELGRLIRQEYAAVFSQDLLENFRNELALGTGPGVDYPQPPERGALDTRAVLQSQYLFS